MERPRFPHRVAFRVAPLGAPSILVDVWLGAPSILVEVYLGAPSILVEVWLGTPSILVRVYLGPAVEIVPAFCAFEPGVGSIQMMTGRY